MAKPWLMGAMAGVMAGFTAHAATLTVGVGQHYTTIAAAIAAARDGDTVNVMAGTYVNDFAEIGVQITLNAVGGMAVLQASENIPNEKAILITDTDVSINGFTFTGARVTADAGGNGAGIRYQGGSLFINNCYFYNNQNGILGAANPTGTITITDSEFYRNGVASGPTSGYTHNLYIGDILRFDIENSYIHAAYVGHEIKSRAQINIINNNRIVDGATGTASYSIDLPNGGAATISNNQIEKGPASENQVIVSFGEEGGLYANSSLNLANNLFENDRASAIGIRNSTSATATIAATQTFHLPASQFSVGSATVSGTIGLAAEPAISIAHPWPH